MGAKILLWTQGKTKQKSFWGLIIVHRARTRARPRGLWQASSGTPQKQRMPPVTITQGGLEMRRLGMVVCTRWTSSVPETVTYGSTTKGLNGYLSRLRNQRE